VPPGRVTRFISDSAFTLSGTKFSVSAETAASRLAAGTSSACASPLRNSTRGSATLARALARKPSEGSMAIRLFGAQRDTIAADSAPVPQPTSSQSSPAGRAIRSRNSGAIRRLHRPI
jgi:hypothetical protein